MHLPYATILALLPLILASPLANHNTKNSPTPTLPKRAGVAPGAPGAPDVSILPISTPPTPISLPTPSASATLQDILTFCASGSVAANLPAVQQFCKLISGFASTAGGISGGAGGTGGKGLGGGILPPLPPIPGVPFLPGFGGK